MAKRTEFTMDEMNRVNGGYVVEGQDGKYYAIKDSDGSIYTDAGPFTSASGALMHCFSQFQNDIVISRDQYKEKYKKDFKVPTSK